MTVPGTVVRETDCAHVALSSLRASGVSCAYVVSDYMRFDGIVSWHGALSVRDGKRTLGGSHHSGGSFCGACLMLQLLSLVPLAAQTLYPLAVLDELDVFRGIVSKASVLSSVSV
jgi:ABC-type proline/glycine betaine transport system, ATPase component